MTTTLERELTRIAKLHQYERGAAEIYLVREPATGGWFIGNAYSMGEYHDETPTAQLLNGSDIADGWYFIRRTMPTRPGGSVYIPTNRPTPTPRQLSNLLPTLEPSERLHTIGAFQPITYDTADNGRLGPVVGAYHHASDTLLIVRAHLLEAATRSAAGADDTTYMITIGSNSIGPVYVVSDLATLNDTGCYYPHGVVMVINPPTDPAIRRDVIAQLDRAVAA